MLDAIGSVSSSPAAFEPPPTAPVTRTQAVAAGMTVETRRTAQIEIMTADGDRVTISAGAMVSASMAAGYAEAQAGDRTGAAAAASMTSSSSTSLSISVEGTLDKDEVKDIQRLVTFLERAASHRPRGRERGHHEGDHGHHRGHDATRRLEHPSFDSLAAVTATFTASRSVQAAAAYQATSTSPQAQPAPVAA